MMKNSKHTKDLITSYMPLGMIFGCAIGVLVGIFFPSYLLLAICLGTGIGYLLGVIVYLIKAGKSSNIM